MKICIDPGHGGTDPGAIGPGGLKEKDVSLTIAIRVAKILQGHGIETILTRQDDRRLDLASRVKIANDRGVDYFVSIHINSATNPRATGTETFAFPGSSMGARLARSIQDSLVRQIALADRGVKYRDFYVLKNTRMPASLVEVAFINNPLEEELLRDEGFLKKAAIGIGQGILSFIGIDYREVGGPCQDASSWAREAMEWAASKEVNLIDGAIATGHVTLEDLITILYKYHRMKVS